MEVGLIVLLVVIGLTVLGRFWAHKRLEKHTETETESHNLRGL